MRVSDCQREADETEGEMTYKLIYWTETGALRINDVKFATKAEAETRGEYLVRELGLIGYEVRAA